MILIIDNYDSFTYNLAQLVGKLNKEFRVARNDALSVEDVSRMRPEGILLSPGPGRPEDAGICVPLIRNAGLVAPLLGVCLGHQALGYAFGASVEHAPALMHGKTSEIFHDGEGMFRNVPLPFSATRYHSLIVSSRGLPSDLEVTAQTSDGVIMGLRHKRRPLSGIQFHPESILTEYGEQLMVNWFVASGIGV